MKKIGVVTSGGDAPGMNAAIRAVVRLAHAEGMEIIGYRRGWEGVVSNTYVRLTPHSVSNVIQTGGTMLHTCRCPEIRTDEVIRQAADRLTEEIDGLVVIGGDGSFRAALALSKLTDVPIVGIPATIDNDVGGTDETVGFDTAVNTCVAEIDKIRDTATSLDRIFVVEVMGRTRGFIAAMVGMTSGAEVILVPEVKVDMETICQAIRTTHGRSKQSGIIVAAEGIGDTGKLARDIEACSGVETRLSIIGYAQRGGSPTARSRYLANRFGEKAVRLLLGGRRNEIAGIVDGEIISIGLEESSRTARTLDMELLQLARDLSR